MPPCPVARSTSSRIRFLSSALNLRRCALAGTSGSGELATKGTAILASLTMILLATPLCNYGRGFCLIDVGTEGQLDACLACDSYKRIRDDVLPTAVTLAALRRQIRLPIESHEDQSQCMTFS